VVAKTQNGADTQVPGGDDGERRNNTGVKMVAMMEKDRERRY
jgi:hypothetical protein